MRKVHYLLPLACLGHGDTAFAGIRISWVRYQMLLHLLTLRRRPGCHDYLLCEHHIIFLSRSSRYVGTTGRFSELKGCIFLSTPQNVLTVLRQAPEELSIKSNKDVKLGKITIIPAPKLHRPNLLPPRATNPDIQPMSPLNLDPWSFKTNNIENRTQGLIVDTQK